MKLSISTTKLQGIVADAAKGVGNNKILPITSMLGITCTEDGEIKFTSTDGTNFLRISDRVVFKEDVEAGHISVDADLFISLVSRLSDCSDISIETNDKLLIISGFSNDAQVGTYKLELPVDEEGNPVKFIDIDSKIEDVKSKQTNSYDIPIAIIEEMRGSCKQALSTNISEPCYTNYLVSDNIVATDRTRAVFVHNNIIDDKAPFLLSRNFVDLMSLADDTLNVIVAPIGMYATDGYGTEVYSNATVELDGYNEVAIKGMLTMQFPSMCKVKKSELLNTLNRMALFCTRYDNAGVDVSFNEGSITITSLKDSAVETIEYLEHKDYEPCDIRIDVNLFISHVKSYASDTVELWFGNSKCVKLVDNDITQIIALIHK